jgi:predicted ATP-dependent serine protease
MNNHELFDKSPIRLIDKLGGSGLAGGDMVLVASKKGLGKTSVLVQFGVDYLLQGRQVVHVSFDQKSDNVITWYENVFTEIARRQPSSSHAPLSELVKKRVILNINQDAHALPRIIATTKALCEGGIKADCLLIDDVKFGKINAADFLLLRSYAQEAGIFVAASVTSEGASLAEIVPPELDAHFDAVFRLMSHPDMIELKCMLYKGAPPPPAKLRLDSKTLLITEVP